MQQQIAVQHRQQSPRPVRREAKRYGLMDREVLVVRLRRERSKPTDDEHGPANYSHRFIVSGHWRNQFYPASGEHRQIYISPYVKGDESLPLVVKPRRAFVLNRMIFEMPWPLDLPDSDRICEDAAGVPVIRAFADEVVGEVASAWWSHERDRKLLTLDLKVPDEYLDCAVSIDWSPRHRRILTVALIPRLRVVG